MSDRSTSVDHYPKAPLIEVACEIRFPGEVAVESNRHLFWESIRESYPQVLVPALVEGDHVALKAYRYRDVNESRIVSVALNSLAYSESSYKTHSEFLEEFEKLHILFSKYYPRIGNATRIGWRYVNAIPFVRADGLAPVSQFFQPSLSILGVLGQGARNLDLKIEIPHGDFEIIVKFGTAIDPAKNQEAFLLDIDCCRTKSDLAFRDAIRAVRECRQIARNVFETLITESYRKYLQGDSI